VTFSAVGNQDISAGTLRLTAGTAGHDNVVQITGQAAQDITVSARLELNGGSGGNNNYARIASLGAAGVQTIDATGADIVLNGGASGGASGLANYADITLGTSNTTGSQTVYAGSIAINGGGNASSYGGAGFGAGNGRNQSFFVTGDLTMTGGASNAGSSSAYIGSQTGGGTIDVQVGGVVTLNGGTGTYGGVMIGSIDDSLGATTVKLSAGKNIAATGGTGGGSAGCQDSGCHGQHRRREGRLGRRSRCPERAGRQHHAERTGDHQDRCRRAGAGPGQRRRHYPRRGHDDPGRLDLDKCRYGFGAQRCSPGRR
jgi:hypothetical protein